MYHKVSKNKTNFIPQPKSRRYLQVPDDNKENAVQKANQILNPTRQFGKDITIAIKNSSLEKKHNNSLGKRSVQKDQQKVKTKNITLLLDFCFH